MKQNEEYLHKLYVSISPELFILYLKTEVLFGGVLNACSLCFLAILFILIVWVDENPVWGFQKLETGCKKHSRLYILWAGFGYRLLLLYSRLWARLNKIGSRGYQGLPSSIERLKSHRFRWGWKHAFWFSYSFDPINKESWTSNAHQLFTMEHKIPLHPGVWNILQPLSRGAQKSNGTFLGVFKGRLE